MRFLQYLILSTFYYTLTNGLPLRQDNEYADDFDEDEDFEDDDELPYDFLTYDDPTQGRRVNNQEKSKKEDLWKINMNRTADVKDDYFFESDIRLDIIQKLHVKTNQIFEVTKSRSKRAARAKEDGQYLWKHNTVYYKIDKGFSRDTRIEIKKGIKHWKRNLKGCLKFVRVDRLSDAKKEEIQRTQFGGNPIEHILFTKTASGCWSQVGRTDTRLDDTRRKYVPGQQLISIGEGCGEKGTVIHEIGHAVGFWHEQSRRDRDDYIKIIKNNILPGQKQQFQRITQDQVDSMGYAYDFWSIMHYGQYFFSKNDRPTIKVVKKYRHLNPTLGQRKGLSYLDIAQVRSMYKCNALPSRESKKVCAKRSTKGRDYRGELDYTQSGVMCQPWNRNYPHTHKYDLNNKADDLKFNYCRNPGGEKERPWCLTTLADKDNNPKWEYCDIKLCES